MMRRFRFGGNMRKTLLALSVMIISSVSFSVSAADSSIQKQLDASPEYIRLQMVEKWNGSWPSVMGNEVNPFVLMDGDSNGSTGTES